MRNKSCKKWIAAALAGVLLFGTAGTGSSVSAAAVEGSADETTTENQADSSKRGWEADIPSMLAAGSYEEGVVVVGIDRNAPAPDRMRGEDGSVVNTGTEMLLEVSEENVLPDAEVSEPEEKGTDDPTSNGQSAGGEDEKDTVSIEIVQDSSKSTEELLYELAKDPRVVFAEPNYISEECTDESADDKKVFDYPSIADGIPGVTLADPDEIADLTPLQWGCWDAMAPTLLSPKGDASVHVPNFGPTGRNMTQEPIVVAVIDYAIDYTNPDIEGVMYHFTEEQQELLGCDEYGYNACWQQPSGQIVLGEGSHGTHCAGIIGASWDGHGISGAASNVKIISIQNSFGDGKTSLINSLRAFAFIDKANENGVGIRVTSNSYGLVQHSVAFDAAVREVGEKYGVVSVFAAGNSDKNVGIVTDVTDTLEDNPYAIVVAATDPSGEKAYFSNFGEGVVDFGAPGVSILSTVSSDRVSYLADAVPLSNLCYEGFEEETSSSGIEICGARFLNQKVTPYPDGQAKRTAEDEPHFAGTHAAKLVLPAGSGLKRAVEFRPGDLSAAKEPLYFGFSYYTPDQYSQLGIYAKNKDGEYVLQKKAMNETSGFGSGWHCASVRLDGDVDLSDPEILALYSTSSEETPLYIDSVGLGTKCVPYAYMSGTSMACPLAAGVVAVLAAEHRELDGMELASLAKSSVRSAASMRGITKSGGILDLGEEAYTPAPVITDVSFENGDIILKGTSFGKTPGRLRVIRRTVGTDPVTVYDSSKVKSGSGIFWSDKEIVLSYPGEAAGLVQLMVENASGKTGSREFMLGKSKNIYEKELPLYEMQEILTVPNGQSIREDYDTEGILTGLGGKLYYIPTITMVEETPASKKMSVFDPENENWEDAPELPEPLSHISAAIYEERLYVMGASMDYFNGEIAEQSGNPAMRVYVFNPYINQWIKVSSEGVIFGQSIVNYNEELFVVGGTEVSLYQPYEGAVSSLMKLDQEILWPSLAAKGDTIYVYDAEQYLFGVIRDRKYNDMTDALPEIVDYYDMDSSENAWVRQGTLVTVEDGILLVGPAQKATVSDEQISDTFLLPYEDVKFRPCARRMSDGKVKASAVAAYRGWIYAIGTATKEPGEFFFRATAMETGECYGDIPRKEDTLKWKHNKTGWWMVYPDGTCPRSEWIRVNGKWYYFAEDGYMAANEWRDGRWLGKNGAWTYDGIGEWKSNKTGSWYEDSLGWYPVSRWQKIDGTWYYFNKKGYAVTGWHMLSGKWYFFRKDGSMLTGWKKSGGKWYYLGADGAMVTDGSITLPGKVTYNFDQDGVCLNP